MSARLPRKLRSLARDAAREGWKWERTYSDHIRFWHPSTPQTVIAADTSRDTKGERILRRQMRRALEAAQ